MAERGHYEVLGVPRDAPSDAIASAYRSRLASPSGRGIASSADIERAFAVLGDPASRARYDVSVGKGGNPPYGRGPWVWILGAFVALLVLTLLNRPAATLSADVPPTGAVAAAPVAQVDAAVGLPPVAAATVGKAARHAGLALGAEGLPGAMVYSVNCYASVARRFLLDDLDRCVAFDALVAAFPPPAGEEAGALETAYFGPEAAAIRFRSAFARWPAEADGGRLDAIRVMAAGTPVVLVERPVTRDASANLSIPTDIAGSEPVGENGAADADTSNRDDAALGDTP